MNEHGWLLCAPIHQLFLLLLGKGVVEENKLRFNGKCTGLKQRPKPVIFFLPKRSLYSSKGQSCLGITEQILSTGLLDGVSVYLFHANLQSAGPFSTYTTKDFMS